MATKKTAKRAASPIEDTGAAQAPQHLRVALRAQLGSVLHVQTCPLSATYHPSDDPENFDQVILDDIDLATFQRFSGLVDMVVVYADGEPYNAKHPVGAPAYDMALGVKKTGWPVNTETRQKRALSSAPIAAITVEDLDGFIEALSAKPEGG